MLVSAIRARRQLAHLPDRSRAKRLVVALCSFRDVVRPARGMTPDSPVLEGMAFTMFRRYFAGTLAVIVVLSVSACGSSGEPDDRIQAPASSSDLKGEQYADVVGDLADAGFTDVKTMALGDLITGWLDGPGEVESVTVNGESDFASNDRFAADAAVIVSYHSFPEDEEVPSESPTPTAAPEEVLTIESNVDFAALLSLTDYCSDSVATFSAEHEGDTIAFDGNIGALNKHGDASTRYDILVGAGDFSETSQPGPAFQFRDVNTSSDLHFTGSDIPDSIGPGINLRITATVGEFESNSCLLLLDPVSTQVR